MKRWPKIKRLVRVTFTPEEFVDCVQAVEGAMRKMGTRDPNTRIELIGGYFKNEEKGLAFTARMECMFEMQHTPNGAKFSAAHQGSTKVTLSVGLLHAAALAPLYFDDDTQFFQEKEFFDIAELEQKALIAAS